jgi:transcriptional regulator with PAS, ATPase and Fis domain
VLLVRDLGGRNGTRLDGETLRDEERAVMRGQEIGVGPARITVVSLPRGERAGGEELVIEDSSMREVMALVDRLAAAPNTVLIRGETGVGKEVIAERLHDRSPRRKGPLVRVNCAAVPESLLESELFGHVKGAFTGATSDKRGFFQAADGGSLFLDEIGDVPLAVQVKLLRALETQRVQPLGSREESAVDVRIITATHRDLEAMVQEQTFRQDLYYRIAGFVLEVPPLRERPLDLAPLARRFLASFGEHLGTVPPALTDGALEALARHAWPGNIRELKNAVEHAAVLAGAGPITAEHLPRTVTASDEGPPAQGVEAESPATMREHVEEAERRAIEQALAAAEGHRGRAAEILGVSKRTLQYKLAKLGFNE